MTNPNAFNNQFGSGTELNNDYKTAFPRFTPVVFTTGPVNVLVTPAPEEAQMVNGQMQWPGERANPVASDAKMFTEDDQDVHPTFVVSRNVPQVKKQELLRTWFAAATKVAETGGNGISAIIRLQASRLFGNSL